MNIIGFDPGKNTGVAVYLNRKPARVGEIRFEDFNAWLIDALESEHFDVFVVEDYIIRPMGVAKGYQHQWNKGEALQVIGAIEYAAYRQGIPVVRQQPAIKPVAAKRSGLPYESGKSGKGRHQADAMLHVEYFLMNDKVESNAS